MSDAPRPEHLPPGYDAEDPYEGEDLDTYPTWWRENIELFREHHMRPYRPSRFADGVILPSLVNELSEELGISIQFRSTNPETTNSWEILVDFEPVGEVRRKREGEGYTQYFMDSSEFESLIRSTIEPV